MTEIMIMRRGGSLSHRNKLGAEGERRGMRVIIHCKSNKVSGLKKIGVCLPRKFARTCNLDASSNAKVPELQNLGRHRPSSTQDAHLATDRSDYTQRQSGLLCLLPKYHAYTRGKHTAGCRL